MTFTAFFMFFRFKFSLIMKSSHLGTLGPEQILNRRALSGPSAPCGVDQKPYRTCRPWPSELSGGLVQESRLARRVLILESSVYLLQDQVRPAFQSGTATLVLGHSSCL